jgi:hypothetical protein
MNMFSSSSRFDISSTSMDMFYNRKTTINQVLRPYLKYLYEGKISLDGVGTTLPRLDTQKYLT